MLGARKEGRKEGRKDAWMRGRHGSFSLPDDSADWDLHLGEGCRAERGRAQGSKARDKDKECTANNIRKRGPR